MEPREIWALLEGDRRRWSRVSELVAWVVWKLIMHLPMSKPPAGYAYFNNFMRANRPPGFLPPKKEEE